MDTDTIGERIRELRVARGWSLQQLADRAGASKPQIDKLERGSRRLTDDWIRRIAEALGIAPEALAPTSRPTAKADTARDEPKAGPAPHGAAADTPEPETLDTVGYDAGYDPGYGVAGVSDILDADTGADTNLDTLPLRGFGRYSAREGDCIGVFVEATAAPERVWRPAPLAGISGAYAVRMPDGAMSPKYEAGQLLFVHPYRTPRSGDAVVVRLAGGRFVVGRLAPARGRAGVTVSLLHPGRELRLDPGGVLAVERVVLAEEP